MPEMRPAQQAKGGMAQPRAAAAPETAADDSSIEAALAASESQMARACRPPARTGRSLRAYWVTFVVIASYLSARVQARFRSEDAILRLLRPGERIVLGSDAYGGTYRLIDKLYGPAGYPWTAADLTDPAALDRHWPTGTRLVWAETPTNPAMAIVDISAVAELAHHHGALLVVDNTFATPYLQQPLALGADVVVHSATKYLGGHSDVVGGCVVTDDPELAEGVGFVQNAAGAVPSPFDCYLVLRGLRTLGVRMDRHCDNARAVVELLLEHPAVERVLWPGLPDHPGADVAKRQMRDAGGMVSFVVRGGEDAAIQLVGRTRLFILAESLGSVESLIEHPHRMTHASAAGSALAVDPGLVRLSVGIETASDLVADLRQALDGL